MAPLWTLVGFFVLVCVLRAFPFRGGKWLLLASGLVLVVYGLYWLGSLYANVPGAEALRAAYSGTARKMGVGVEYPWGPFGIAALVGFGLFGMAVVLFPSRKG